MGSGFTFIIIPVPYPFAGCTCRGKLLLYYEGVWCQIEKRKTVYMHRSSEYQSSGYHSFQLLVSLEQSRTMSVPFLAPLGIARTQVISLTRTKSLELLIHFLIHFGLARTQSFRLLDPLELVRTQVISALGVLCHSNSSFPWNPLACIGGS